MPKEEPTFGGFLCFYFLYSARGFFFLFQIVALSSVYIDRPVTKMKVIAREGTKRFFNIM